MSRPAQSAGPLESLRAQLLRVFRENTRNN